VLGSTLRYPPRVQAMWGCLTLLQACRFQWQCSSRYIIIISSSSTCNWLGVLTRGVRSP
jgi:hypothetical protein